MASFDAVLIADSAPVRGAVCGLTLVERARRVVTRAGAARVLVVDSPETRAQLAAWWAEPARAQGVLVVRCGDQLVHSPLVQPLVEAVDGGAAAAVVPVGAVATDLPAGAMAGAVLAMNTDADALVQLLAAGETVEHAASTLAGVAHIPHGEVARHPVRTPVERAAAQRLLYRILIKPQDNAITRYLYRPVSLPLTRLLVKTPITPNQVSLLVAVMVAIGIWFTAHASMNYVLIGTVIILAGSYLDCCDGEIARVKLLSSKFGAWIDTIVDETSTIGYVLALGWHCQLYFGPHYFDSMGWPGSTISPWLFAMAIAGVFFVVAIYGLYWNIIVMVGSANSQDYVGRYTPEPGPQPGTVRLAPATANAVVYSKRPLPAPLQMIVTALPYAIRRDFLSWVVVFLAALHVTQLSFLLQAIGTVVTGLVVGLDHLRVRRQRRDIARSGNRLVA